MNNQDPVSALIAEFARLPGIGNKTAERLAFHVINRPKSEAISLADALKNAKEAVKSCAECYNISSEEICPICISTTRDKGIICVVEQARDLWAIERTGRYRSMYHVLHGAISPIDGVGPEHLTIAKLIDRVKAGGVKEVILATNPTAEGDTTAFYIQRALAGAGAKITRIAKGIPAGSSLEYANRAIVMDAIEGRKEL